jgi:hypothetical protein
VSRGVGQRVDDIEAACLAIRAHVARGGPEHVVLFDSDNLLSTLDGLAASMIKAA